MGSPIDDLPAAQIKALVETDPALLPAAVAAVVRDFIERIGGLENARLAAAMLERLEPPDSSSSG